MLDLSAIAKGGSSPLVRCVRPRSFIFKGREQEGSLGRGFADWDNARGYREKFHWNFRFFFLADPCILILLVQEEFGNNNFLREDLLDASFQPVLRLQFCCRFLFSLFSFPEQ
jgi:hypothetical protein